LQQQWIALLHRYFSKFALQAVALKIGTQPIYLSSNAGCKPAGKKAFLFGKAFYYVVSFTIH